MSRDSVYVIIRVYFSDNCCQSEEVIDAAWTWVSAQALKLKARASDEGYGYGKTKEYLVREIVPK